MSCSWIVLGFGVLALGCGPQVLLDDGDSGEDDTSGSVSTTAATTPPPPPTTGPPPVTTTPMPTSTTVPPPLPDSSDTAEDDVTFIEEPDTPPSFECDLWEQDCPEGFKCSPYNNDGGSYWNASACVPIADNPAEIGEYCTVEDHPYSGIDDCGPAALCFFTDEETLEGRCFGLCIGDETNPSCAVEGYACILPSDGPGLCLNTCNPLEPDCLDDRACYPWDDRFFCEPVDAEAQAGEGCEYLNGCAAGLACVDSSFVSGCADLGCCSSYCEVGELMPPCLPDQVCTPWYEPGEAPPGYENVGVCALP